MPRYDYECDNCHHCFELIQSFHEEPMADCPRCGRMARRKFSLVPIIFKGSGWYVNDQAKGSKNSTFSTAAKEESEGEGGKAGAKSETKTEPKKGLESSKAEVS